jgi:hypothetical protein
VIGSLDVAAGASFEAREARMRDDEPADRLTRADVVLIGHRNLDVAAEGERCRIALLLATGLSCDHDRIPEALDIGAHREAHAVGPPDTDADRAGACRGDVHRRRRSSE